MNIVFKNFIHDETKMGAFGTIAIVIFCIILIFFHRFSKPGLGFINVVGNLW
jgi:hypothetical protein